MHQTDEIQAPPIVACSLPITLDESAESSEQTELALLRSAVLNHLSTIGLSANHQANGLLSKESIRAVHGDHRLQAARAERDILRRHGQRLLSHFADGSEIDVARISPYLVEVQSDTADAELFRAATLLWSVPVSKGFGRRIRFLVKDAQNDKLIGIIALGDPVFNLACRDKWIGWNVHQRTDRLVNVMDAYVLGAVPPYSQLIGGKLVAAAVTSSEVSKAFDAKYNATVGVIAKQAKHARLVLVTTTSSLGRSSIYNRLKLPGLVEYMRLGTTEGWGHFQIPDSLFEQMRALLAAEGHKYASGHKYGDGPNWRVRVIRASLKRLGLSEDLLRHGIRREAYGVPLASNWREFLIGTTDQPQLARPTLAEITEASLSRWHLRRAATNPSYRAWTRQQTMQLLMKHFEVDEQQTLREQHVEAKPLQAELPIAKDLVGPRI
jgi:hypothetical protein